MAQGTRTRTLGSAACGRWQSWETVQVMEVKDHGFWPPSSIDEAPRHFGLIPGPTKGGTCFHLWSPKLGEVQ
ncbi:MAG: hypothetical protein AB7I27_15430 [Bacteriovoracaceae bacterium]